MNNVKIIVNDINGDFIRDYDVSENDLEMELNELKLNDFEIGERIGNCIDIFEIT